MTRHWDKYMLGISAVSYKNMLCCSAEIKRHWDHRPNICLSAIGIERMILTKLAAYRCRQLVSSLPNHETRKFIINILTS